MSRKGQKKNFKSGAAAFYIVAFSTLILTIVAIGFAVVIVSELTRSSNDDLSQSAFDSALAGVEDAKLAYYNYQTCIEKGASATAPNMDSSLNCNEIVYYMENPDCDMVAHILGRKGENDEGEVIVEESSTAGNNMAQAYTCVQIKTSLSDYRGTLTSGNNTRIIRVKLDGVAANEIAKARISWYENDGLTDLKFNNFNATSDANRGVVFRSLGSVSAATPPTIGVQLVQTGASFNLSDFDRTVSGSQTNRATLTLVPTDSANYAKSSRTDNYVGAYNATARDNLISEAQIVKSNDKTVKNLPYAVYCNGPEEGAEFVCSALMTLPKPIGGTRSDDTFMFVVSLPYGQPDTDFALEFFCADGSVCGTVSAEDTDGLAESQARLKGIQVSIDSTGRANDLFRRVEARLEPSDTNFPYPLYALQLLGTGNESLINKNLTVTKEWGL